LALLFSTGCQDRVASAADALEAGNAYLAKTTQMEMNGFAVRMDDMGDRWRLSYWNPEEETGFFAIVVVNKRSGRVVHFERRQFRGSTPS
jgi:hypothetical protein